MDDHLTSIEESINNSNYYSALYMAIMLPSICGALESDDGRDTKQKYIDWYNRYISNLFLTGEDCYQLRCSLVHQATTINPNSAFSRVIFTFPVASGNTLHNNVMNDALNLDIPLFCQQLVEGARRWLNDMKNNSNYSTNIQNTVKLHPDGLPPFISGHPVIS